MLYYTFRRNNGGILHVDDAPAFCPMPDNDRVFRIPRKKDYPAGTVRSHAGHERISRIQYRSAGARRDVLDDHALDRRQILDGIDMGEAQMVTSAYICDHRHVAAIKTQSLTQQATAGSFQHGSIDIGMKQHFSRTLGTAAI